MICRLFKCANVTMTGELAQIIALISYGNEYLVSGKVPSGFYPGNEAFEFCKVIHFIDVHNTDPNSILIADSPVQWFHKLAEKRCIHLSLLYKQSAGKSVKDDRETAAFVGGGGIWVINSLNNDGTINSWAPNWSVIAKDAPDKKIWGINYKMIFSGKDITKPVGDIKLIKMKMKLVLRDIAKFANTHDFRYWGKIFEEALAMLDSEKPEATYYPNLILAKNYSLEARQLLFACEKSSVFGGMGSWNDIMFDNPAIEKEYQRLSDDLFSIVNNGFMASVNSKIIAN